MTPYKHNFGQTITTDVEDVSCDRGFISHFQVAAADAVAESATAVHAAVTLTASTQNVTTAITNPAVPRNMTITGNASGITGNVVLTGTNYAGESITETIALNGTATVVGNKAFKTVTNIALPAKTNSSGDTVSIGTGSKLGLPYKLAHNTLIYSFSDNTKEGTASTVATSSTALDGNTILLNTALAGKVIDAYFIV